MLIFVFGVYFFAVAMDVLRLPRSSTCKERVLGTYSGLGIDDVGDA